MPYWVAAPHHGKLGDTWDAAEMLWKLPLPHMGDGGPGVGGLYAKRAPATAVLDTAWAAGREQHGQRPWIWN